MTTDVHRTTEAVWRIESARVIAGVARIVRDIGLAEDLAQDALVAATAVDAACERRTTRTIDSVCGFATLIPSRRPARGTRRA